MVEKVIEEEKQIITLNKYPEWADHFDKGLIDIVINAKKSMSINTLKNEFLKRCFNFNERIERLCNTGFLKRWEQEKPTLQIGTEEDYKKFKIKGG